MTVPPDDALEQLLRSGLSRHAADAPDRPDLTGIRTRAARHRRRRLQGAGLASTALVVAVAAVLVAGSSPSSSTTHDALGAAPNTSNGGPVTGSLLLPLTGTVQAGGLQLEPASGSTTTSGQGSSAPGGSSGATRMAAAPTPSNGGGAS